jgi:hypothetical protein
MSKKPAQKLPDLEEDDSAFQRRMQPLVDRALPVDRRPGKPDSRITEYLDNHIADETEIRESGVVEAAQALQRIEDRRGAKRRFEYVIPERVGKALARDAASRGISATTRLLEILRDSGYPVIPEDLIDLRKLPKR